MFVHSRKDTVKTARVLVELAQSKGEVDSFLDLEHPQHALFKVVFCTVLYLTVLYCAVLYHATLRCAVLCCTVHLGPRQGALLNCTHRASSRCCVSVLG